MTLRKFTRTLVFAIFVFFLQITLAAPGGFVYTGSLNAARFGHTSTLLNNGMVLVTGGDNALIGAPQLSSAELYNPTSGTFSNTGSLHTARDGHTATLLNNGMVLIAGGNSGAI